MARPMLNNFTRGELSPRLRGRVDFDGYYCGCEVLKNFIILPQGGITRRPGSYFVAAAKTSAHPVRVISFQYSTEQAYIIELGHQYMRFYKDGGQIETSLGSGVPYEIATPYAGADLFGLHFAQTADTMYIAHGNHAPRKLTRTGHTSWTLSTVDFYHGPYGDEATLNITPSGTSGSITLTAASSLFASTDVGRLIAIYCSDSKWYHLKITAYTDATHVTATVRGSDANYAASLPGTSAASKYRMGSWTSVLGYPRTVTFFEQRLMFGGTATRPQTVWGSQSADYEKFLAGTNDSDAVEFTLADDQVNAIVWMIPRERLIIGTTGGEARLGSTSDLEALTPTNVTCRMPTAYGSADIRPIRIGADTLFVQRGGRTVRNIAYDIQYDVYDAQSVSVLSEHITRGGIVDVAYQQEPFPVVWYVRGDGVLLGFTYLKEQEVAGWHWHDTDGEFESVATIAGSGSEDEVWVVVKRTIGGDDLRYIEYFKPVDFGDDQEDAFYVDSGLSYDGSPVNSVSGLSHLEGKEVHILADGAAHPPATVASGTIALEAAASVIHVGLPYESHLKPMNLEAAMQSGTGQGQYKKVMECTVRLLDTLGLKIGRDEDHLDVIPFRGSGDLFGSPPALFSGDMRIKTFRGDWSTDAYVYIVQDLPLPATILGIIPEIVNKEG